MSATFLVDFPHAYVGDASIRPQAALTASANGGGVDLQTSDGVTTLLVTIGATDFSSGDETYTFKLQESDTSGGTYTDIAGSVTIAYTAAGGSVQNVTGAAQYLYRTKRWVRAVVTIAGTTPSILCTALVFSRGKVDGTGNGAQL